MPPPEQRRAGRIVAIVIVGIVAIVAALTVIGLVVGSDDDSAGGDVQEVDVPEGFTTVVDDEHGLSIDLAPGWFGVPLSGDATGAGAKAAPNDPEVAEAIDAAVGTLPRQALFFGVDGDDVPDLFVANLNILSVPLEPGTSIDDAEAEAEPGLRSFGATNISTLRIRGAMGEGLRVTYSYSGSGALAGVDGRQYYFLSGSTGWILTFVSDDIEADEALFDAMAVTFEAKR